MPGDQLIKPDSWSSLKAFTNARIALGRTGTAVPLNESLQFKLAHAEARDAVYSVLDTEGLQDGLQHLKISSYQLHTRARDRMIYLQRPDLGRMLDDASAHALEIDAGDYDIAIIIADGLSATAVNMHAIPLLQLLVPRLIKENISLAPVVLLQQGRVAAGDEIGSLLRAKLSLMLIGERPGLTSPDSMGAYLTYAPQKGFTDERRNCISNIRPEGLQYNAACDKIFYLIKESLRLKLSGIELKDNTMLLHA
ncbi:ethanolamine ammonia-lyase subunit EutC [Danxiaibacter flavus]|uniref:Ethanolamine ammonia-lyase small subunit n=1 Tax=Danxiaibacter flavus TaxID=3049108 RepID=A0ABV3ZPS3_9BACT|nr:ethanolamine ammonia-lyase subunit EutC [Chitinophagaceae bacterium DXS]